MTIHQLAEHCSLVDRKAVESFEVHRKLTLRGAAKSGAEFHPEAQEKVSLVPR